ncbi:hypothetical protein [Geothrix edaphica]|jgi:hypothetical protein|uniref:Uncharacterized protein n=1 Tax=Geothrix edaphica TaxID=2927976 RepID=A0ABQ5PVR0_9BACT|nr:hypothetical protein [Geothrix edaphica]GLH66547.1 hypothetical protein GETHED_09110 [Geothrix edaphica]
MTKPLVPADLLQQVQAADKPVSVASAGKPKADSHPKPMVKASARPQGKSSVAHTRMSNRGK